MGGVGSGNWWRWRSRKTTVEESLSLAMKDFRGRLVPNTSSYFTWKWNRGGESSVGYSIGGTHDFPTLTLRYRCRDEEDVRIPIQLTETPTRFGRPRRWFVCPLILEGVPCARRCGKLYLPPGARYFGCRVCYRLTYRSAQEAHQDERVFARLGFGPDAARLWKARRGRGG